MDYREEQKRRKSILKRKVGYTEHSLKCKNDLTMFCPKGYGIDPDTVQIRRK